MAQNVKNALRNMSQRSIEVLKKRRSIMVARTIPYLIKESAGRQKYIRAFDSSPHRDVLSKLRKDGVLVLGQLFSAEECTEWRQILLEQIDSNPEQLKNYEDDGDHRFYGINEMTDAFDPFVTHQTLRDIRDTYLGALKSGFLLGAHIRSKPGNLGSGGGWHRDSAINAQMKIICYLSDTNGDNGPFQYVRGSHRNYATLAAAATTNKKFRQSRYHTDDYNHVFENDSRIMEFLAPAGTVILADTSGIHRGKPLETGERFALTQYLFHEHHTSPPYSKLPRPSRLPEFVHHKGRGFENQLTPIDSTSE